MQAIRSKQIRNIYICHIHAHKSIPLRSLLRFRSLYQVGISTMRSGHCLHPLPLPMQSDHIVRLQQRHALHTMRACEFDAEMSVLTMQRPGHANSFANVRDVISWHFYSENYGYTDRLASIFAREMSEDPAHSHFLWLSQAFCKAVWNEAGLLAIRDLESKIFTGSPAAAVGACLAIALPPNCEEDEEAAKFLLLLAPYNILTKK
jgi:hypothetical protein